MITFFTYLSGKVIAIYSKKEIQLTEIEKLRWLLDTDSYTSNSIDGVFVGARSQMISPWSTNAVELMNNMGIHDVLRIEQFFPYKEGMSFDTMLQQKYDGLTSSIFEGKSEVEAIQEIDDIAKYNQKEGLALSGIEVEYLEGLSEKLDRRLTDAEVFGFSQVNSEHCRHKIFNGIFSLEGKAKDASLFELIKRTSKKNPNSIVSAYSDNVSFVEGGNAVQFAPKGIDSAAFFEEKTEEMVLSLKAETHNFPTTVEPFYGSATGSGGEIRDRMAGGKGSVPVAGMAIYMTAYPRIGNHSWEKNIKERSWLYQSPLEILIKASNGASDYGNKFGQPLINGAVLTFEHEEKEALVAYDKVIMLAGGIGYGKKSDSLKDDPKKGDLIVVLGGENYRIGMGGSAVSSIETGELSSLIELNAVQRANPEMQKRVANVIRLFTESDKNPIVSIHDHGAGGHLNCLSELIEKTGGIIDVDCLPKGDPTLSFKELIGNESQERIGIVIERDSLELVRNVCERERAPFYVVGEITGDGRLSFISKKTGEKVIDLSLADFFGNPPKLEISDSEQTKTYQSIGDLNDEKLFDYVTDVLQMESVASKEWLVHKVDRSVTGKVAKQQTSGVLQVPVNNVGVTALDYKGKTGTAIATGFAPLVGLIDPRVGAQYAIIESLMNVVWAPLKDGIKSVSLSANWMWPCKNKGEDYRLYEAVEAVSDLACDLGINIPTGKDSLSMTQTYDDKKVQAPGTVIVTASGLVSDIRKVVEPTLKEVDSTIIYIDVIESGFELAGSVFAQTRGRLGEQLAGDIDAKYIVKVFNSLQGLINNGMVLSGHDVSDGGLITTLLEMNFGNLHSGMGLNLDGFQEHSVTNILLSEKPGIVIQVTDSKEVMNIFRKKDISAVVLGDVTTDGKVSLFKNKQSFVFDVAKYHQIWRGKSRMFDQHQLPKEDVDLRYKKRESALLSHTILSNYTKNVKDFDRSNIKKVNAAIIREKGVNGDREMAYALYLAGFNVKDIHMTDLASGREDLSDVNMIVFVGGFSNSDVLGSAKGWAGAFKYNAKAKAALDNFYNRQDTLSLGVCNGCQLMMELGLVENNGKLLPMQHNDVQKFESAYLSVNIPKNNSVMLSSLEGMTTGVWIAHGEGKFVLRDSENLYGISMKYSGKEYPKNPNGSDYNAAALVSNDGRHLAMMPHIERTIFPWQCAYQPEEYKNAEVTPWMKAFVNAYDWIFARIN